jgi:hypothetical protein
VISRLLRPARLGAIAGLLLATFAATGASAATSAAARASIWSVVPTVSPQSGQLDNSFLQGVSMASTTNGWAVGEFMDPATVIHPLVEHWNGTRWLRVTAPAITGVQSVLQGVDDLSTTNAWAVGLSGTGSGEINIDQQPLIEHWNGTAWSVASTPALPVGETGTLTAIGGSGPTDLWAAGTVVPPGGSVIDSLVEHYNGTSWTIVPFSIQSACSTDLVDCFFSAGGVSASSPTDAWIVGNIAQPNPTVNLAAHWNGTTWQIVTAPALHDGTGAIDELTGVTDLSPTNGWASGYEANANGANFHVPYVLHWNGTAWSLTKTPNRGGEGSLLRGITALSATDIWAVGQVQQLNGTISTLTEQFTGTTWSAVASPNPGGVGNDSLAAVASPGGSVVFAAGAHETSGQCCLRALGLRTASG